MNGELRSPMKKELSAVDFSAQPLVCIHNAEQSSAIRNKSADKLAELWNQIAGHILQRIAGNCLQDFSLLVVRFKDIGCLCFEMQAFLTRPASF